MVLSDVTALKLIKKSIRPFWPISCQLFANICAFFMLSVSALMKSFYQGMSTGIDFNGIFLSLSPIFILSAAPKRYDGGTATARKTHLCHSIFESPVQVCYKNLRYTILLCYVELISCSKCISRNFLYNVIYVTFNLIEMNGFNCCWEIRG